MKCGEGPTATNRVEGLTGFLPMRCASSHRNLYGRVSELEVLENQANDFKIFSKTLTDKGIGAQTEVYNDLEHMGTAIPTFESGIQLFLTK